MNNSAINKYLANTSNKNIHLENNKYTNQLVHLNANNNIPHGLVQLPRNIRAIHGPDSLMHGTVKISDALKIVHNKGGGVVFGMFCRGTRGTLKTGPGKKVLLNEKVILKGLKGPHGSPFNNLLKTRKNIKGRVIKPKAPKSYKRRVVTKAPALNYGNF